MASLLTRFLILSLFAANAAAWISFRPLTVETHPRTLPATGRLSMSEENTEVSYEAQAQLEWISNETTAASMVPFRPPRFPANIEVVSSKAVCSSTASVWKQPSRNRLVYILGTCHISKISADLAGQLVRDIHPNAVFIELDKIRVDYLIQNIHQKQALKNPIIPLKEISFLAPVLSSPVAEGKTVPWWRPRGLFRRLRQYAFYLCALFVSYIFSRGFQNLKNQGFSPGEELVTTAMEAQKQGAEVILGDRDWGITLGRLTQALMTDLKQLIFSRRDADGDDNSLSVMNLPDEKEIMKMVESTEAREYVRALITMQKKDGMPLTEQVMLTERDEFMADFLDMLNQFQCIVAVMGIAHMDGVESILRERGWTDVKPMRPEP